MKFIDSVYDEETGIATVTYLHKGKKYIGNAIAHPEEFSPTELTGCRYAESRAYIKLFKDEYISAKREYEDFKKFLNHCLNYKDFTDEKSIKIMYRQINMAKKKMLHKKHIYESAKKALKSGMDKRDKLLKAKITANAD